MFENSKNLRIACLRRSVSPIEVFIQNGSFQFTKGFRTEQNLSEKICGRTCVLPSLHQNQIRTYENNGSLSTVYSLSSAKQTEKVFELILEIFNTRRNEEKIEDPVSTVVTRYPLGILPDHDIFESTLDS